MNNYSVRCFQYFIIYKIYHYCESCVVNIKCFLSSSLLSQNLTAISILKIVRSYASIKALNFTERVCIIRKNFNDMNYITLYKILSIISS